MTRRRRQGAGANGATKPSVEQGGQPYGRPSIRSISGPAAEAATTTRPGAREWRRRDRHGTNGGPQRDDHGDGSAVGSCASGGGAGGTVNIQAANLSGTGSISAKGGHNPNSNSGAGGGGRIWVQGSRPITSPAPARRPEERTSTRPRTGRRGRASARPLRRAQRDFHLSEHGVEFEFRAERHGHRFQFLSGSGTTLKLTETGQSDIVAANVVVQSASQLTATFNLVGQPTGLWNVVVINPRGPGHVVERVTIQAAIRSSRRRRGDGQWNTATTGTQLRSHGQLEVIIDANVT